MVNGDKADQTVSRQGYLGVTRSLSGRLWRERPAEPDVVRRHQLNHGLSEPVARALASRGVGVDAGQDFLHPTLKAQFPDPSSFADMDRAAEILVDALTQGRKVAVFADYDVDGASSAAQLVRWFRAMGLEISIYVPDRILEGYGPSPAAFRRLKDEGADLVITVDCGAAAYDALKFAAEIELPVVVVDHHLMRAGEIPAVAALVGWLVSMTTRQAGHFFFEPKGYDVVNRATHEYKEEIKVGYNLQRKTVLLAIWAASPLALVLEPTLFGLLEAPTGKEGFILNVGLVWLALGIGGLLFRTVHLFFIRDVNTGIVWAIKILTDPFHDLMLYYKAPFYLMRGQLIDPMGHPPRG